MQNPDLKAQVLHELKPGKSTAIPGRVLAQRLGCKTDRGIRRVILELIKDGTPILGSSSSPKGYYIAENIEEIQAQREVLVGYIVELARHRRDLKFAIRTLQHEKQLALIAGY